MSKPKVNHGVNTPFRPPQTQVALRATKQTKLSETKQNETKQLPPLTPPKDSTSVESGGSGQFFKIDLYGERFTEQDWLLRYFRARLHSKGKRTAFANTLKELLSLYPDFIPAFQRWVTLPLYRRMAAYAYASMEKTPDDFLAFCTKAVEQDWESLGKYLGKMEEAVKQGDYEVKISA